MFADIWTNECEEDGPVGNVYFESRHNGGDRDGEEVVLSDPFFEDAAVALAYLRSHIEHINDNT